MSNIKVNKAKCASCGDVIESKFRHDFVTCNCFKNSKGNQGIYIDGGKDYLRRGGDLKNYIDLSEVKNERKTKSKKNTKTNK